MLSTPRPASTNRWKSWSRSSASATVHADRAAADVKVRLRHDRPFPGRVAVPGHADPGVHQPPAGAGERRADLLAEVADEVVRYAAAQLDDRVGQGGAVRPAHAVTVLRVLPPDRVDRTVRSGRRARSPWLRRASSARQAAPAGASQRRRPSVRRAAVSEVTVGPDGEALVRSGSFSRWMAGAGPGADVPRPCRRAAWTPGGERLVQACPVPVGRGDGPVGQPSPVSAGLGGGSSTVRAGAVVLADRASRPAASATGRHLPSTSGGRRGERAQRAADERGQRVRRGLGPEHGVGQRRPTRRIRAGSPASSRSRCRSGPEPAVRAGPASRTAMTRRPRCSRAAGRCPRARQ